MTTTQIEPDRQHTIDAVAGLFARYGLVIVIAWYGALKFMNYEAQGIAPLVSASPLMSWVYDIFSVYTFSALLGVFELAAAVLLAVKPWWPRAAAAGSLLAPQRDAIERLSGLRNARLFVIGERAGSLAAQVNERQGAVIADHRDADTPDSLQELLRAHRLAPGAVIMVGSAERDRRLAESARLARFLWARDYFGN